MSQLPIESAIPRFKANEERIDVFVNQNGSYVTSDGVTVPTLPSLAQTIQTRYLTIVNRGDWATSINYAMNDVVKQGGYVYLCVTPHASTVFATDLAALKWILYQAVGLNELDEFGKRNYKNQIPKHLSDLYSGIALVIDCFGDSTMWAADTANLATQSPEPAPLHLQTILRRYYASNLVTVNNKAISGTSIQQMITGTDGSGKTFEQRMIESTAKIVFCNHGINSVQLAESADSYKANLHEYVRLCRKYGKTPVLVTPNPIFPMVIGDRRKCENLKYYVKAMKEVSNEASVVLCDNHEWFLKIMQTGKYRDTAVIPDGVHPSNPFYLYMGRNMAMVLLTNETGLTNKNQYLHAYSSQVLATNPSSVVDERNRFGGTIVTPDASETASQSIRVAVVVEEPGLDIYSAHVMWGNGTDIGSVYINRAQYAYPFKLKAMSGRSDGMLITDHEIRLIKNADPGLHFIEYEVPATAGAGALSLNHIRARAAQSSEKRIAIRASDNYRKILVSNYEMTSVGIPSITLFDEIPTPRIDTDLEFEFKAKLIKNSGVIFNGLTLSNLSTASTVEPGVLIALDANGFLGVWENVAGGNNRLFTGTTDLSVLDVQYYVKFTAGYGALVSVYTNQALAAEALTTQPYMGGFFGFWKGDAIGTMFVERVNSIIR